MSDLTINNTVTTVAVNDGRSTATVNQANGVISVSSEGLPGPSATTAYGSFQDTTTQTPAAANTAYAITLNTTDFTNGVTLSDSSRLNFLAAGVYNVQWSGQFQNSNNADHDVRVWIKVNGAAVVGSTGFISVPSKHGSVNGHTVVGWNYFVQFSAGDYLQFFWSADSAAVTLEAYAAGTAPVTPSTASVIVTANRVS